MLSMLAILYGMFTYAHESFSSENHLLENPLLNMAARRIPLIAR